MMPWRFYWRTGGLAIVLAFLLFFFERNFPPLQLINLKGRDLFLRIHHEWSKQPPEARKLVLVTVDNPTLARLENRWPYPRSIYAEALRAIEPYQPRAVGFDLIFSGNDYVAENDLSLAEAMKEAGNVVIATHESLDGQVGPSGLMQDSAWSVGIVDKPRDRDRVIRRAYLSWRLGGEERRSWELELFTKAFPGVKTDLFPSGSSLPINYLMQFDDFDTISFWRLAEREVEANEIRNRIVLIGLTAEAFHDIHQTPLGSMPGLAVNANVLLMLMTGAFFTSLPWYHTAIITVLSFWLALLVAVSSSALISSILVCFTALVLLGASFLLFSAKVIFDLWLVVVGMALIFVGAVIFRQGQLFFENIRLQEESARDPLTGFYNRRFLTVKLESEFNHLTAKRGWGKSRYEISVIMLDLDHFKLVNDSFGHAEGDRVLCTMAEAIRSSVRKNELICRFGGDEFCVILPNTPIQDAIKFGEKIRKLIAENPDLVYRTAGGVDTVRVTASVGVTSVSIAKASDSAKLLKAADRALYRAKAGGRNQVCVFDPVQDVIA